MNKKIMYKKEKHSDRPRYAFKRIGVKDNLVGLPLEEARDLNVCPICGEALDATKPLIKNMTLKISFWGKRCAKCGTLFFNDTSVHIMIDYSDKSAWITNYDEYDCNPDIKAITSAEAFVKRNDIYFYKGENYISLFIKKHITPEEYKKSLMRKNDSELETANKAGDRFAKYNVENKPALFGFEADSYGTDPIHQKGSSGIRKKEKPKKSKQFLDKSKNGLSSQYSNNKFDEYNRESVLRKNGYNVTAKDNLPPSIRHERLVDIIRSKKCSKSEVETYLESFIEDHRNKEQDKYAVEKWKDDLEFVKKLK